MYGEVAHKKHISHEPYPITIISPYCPYTMTTKSNRSNRKFHFTNNLSDSITTIGTQLPVTSRLSLPPDAHIDFQLVGWFVCSIANKLPLTLKAVYLFKLYEPHKEKSSKNLRISLRKILWKYA